MHNYILFPPIPLVLLARASVFEEVHHLIVPSRWQVNIPVVQTPGQTARNIGTAQLVDIPRKLK